MFVLTEMHSQTGDGPLMKYIITKDSVFRMGRDVTADIPLSLKGTTSRNQCTITAVFILFQKI